CLFAAYSGTSGTPFAARSLLTLKTKHILCRKKRLLEIIVKELSCFLLYRNAVQTMLHMQHFAVVIVFLL
ncbi:MAG: hypothetical protein J6J59_01545, partial [Peptococcaceae bacterium]|nr:hypothetical protein [Peptococcaceae bacterium]